MEIDFTKARLLQIECTMQGMIAENEQRKASLHSPAYVEEDFQKLVDEIQELINTRCQMADKKCGNEEMVCPRQIDDKSCGDCEYALADKDWRPENWDEILEDYSLSGAANYVQDFEAGASAMHQADVEYLDAPCTEHMQSSPYMGKLHSNYYPEHRKDCPACYQAWKEGKI